MGSCKSSQTYLNFTHTYTEATVHIDSQAALAVKASIFLICLLMFWWKQCVVARGLTCFIKMEAIQFYHAACLVSFTERCLTYPAYTNSILSFVTDDKFLQTHFLLNVCMHLPFFFFLSLFFCVVSDIGILYINNIFTILLKWIFLVLCLFSPCSCWIYLMCKINMGQGWICSSHSRKW